MQIFFHVQLAFPDRSARRESTRILKLEGGVKKKKRAFLIIKMPSFPFTRCSFKSLSTILHARYYQWALPCIWRGFLYLSGTTRIRRHEGERSTGMTPFSIDSLLLFERALFLVSLSRSRYDRTEIRSSREARAFFFYYSIDVRVKRIKCQAHVKFLRTFRVRRASQERRAKGEIRDCL